MSPSPHTPPAQANRVTTSIRRTAGPAALVLLVAASLALLSAPAAAQSMAVCGPADTAVTHASIDDGSDRAATEPAGIEVVRTMGAAQANADAAGPGQEGTRTDTASSAGVIEPKAARPAGASHHASEPLVVGTDGDPTEVVVAHPARDTDRARVAGDAVGFDQAEPVGAGNPVELAVTGDRASSNERAIGGYSVAELAGGDRLELPWRLGPLTPFSPATAGGIAIGFLLGAGAYAAIRPGRNRLESRPTDRPHVADADDETADIGIEDDDMLPDEAVVEGMLLSQDGRMKQSAIVNMTDWSKAKVSRLLSTMAEEGRVVKVRIGRENLICLDGWEPDALRSPHPG